MPSLSRFLVLRVPTPSPLLSTEEKVLDVVRQTNVQFDLITGLLRAFFGQAGEAVLFESDIDVQGFRLLNLADPQAEADGTNRRFVTGLTDALKDEIEELRNTIHDDLPLTSGQTIVLQRAVPTTVDDAIELGSFVLTHDAHTFDIAATVSDSGFSVAKAWTIVVNRSINSDWQIALPLFDTGAGSSQNFDLDVKQTDADSKVSLRLRRSAGTTAGTATVQIRPRGNVSDLFTESQATASVTAPVLFLESAILTVVDGRIGVNTKTPLNLLHLSQASASAVQLRLTDTVTPTDVTIRAAANLCDLDVVPASGTDTALVRVFRSTNTSGATTLVVFVGNNTATANAQIAGNGNTYFAANNGNVSIGSSAVGASAVKVLLQATGTAPSSSPADAYQQYAADVAAGNCAPHFRTENGSIVKLFTGAALTAADATVIDATYGSQEQGVLNNVRLRLGELEARLQALGIIG